jgi:hypothetical protein
MNEQFIQFTEEFNKICGFEDNTQKIKAIDNLIEETASSKLPDSIKKRLIKTFAENQVRIVASLDFGGEQDIY